MEVGSQFIFQNTHEGMSDAEMMRKETEIALLAEEVGMDFLLFAIIVQELDLDFRRAVNIGREFRHG